MPEDRDPTDLGPEVEEKDQIPQEGAPPSFVGGLHFTCCGKLQNLKSTTLSTNVVCFVCHTSYRLALEAVPPTDAKYPAGTKLRLLREVLIKVGSKQILYKRDEVVTVGDDTFGVLGTLEDQTLILLDSPAITGQPRALLVALPNDALEEIQTP